MIDEFREAMIKQFEMTNMELICYFLGIGIYQFDRGTFISQKKYADDILKKSKMDAAKPILNPLEEKLNLTKKGTGRCVDPTYFKSLVGSLKHLTSTRPKYQF